MKAAIVAALKACSPDRKFLELFRQIKKFRVNLFGPKSKRLVYDL